MSTNNVGVRFIEPKRRKQLRVKGYDYKSDGYYFVTICTYMQRPCITAHRQQIEQILLSLPHRFNGVKVDWYVLMPTHIHVIFILHDAKVALAEIVRTFKALVTRATERPFWQRNYYEHVIRSDGALLKIREYIENNPLVDKIKFEEFYEKGRMNPTPTLCRIGIKAAKEVLQ